MADREHIRVQLNSTEDHLFISKPVIGRASGQWSVQLTRRFMNRDGSIGGVIVVSLNPEHFTNFYDKIDLGLAASIAMIGSDGVVRASGGGAAGRFALGQDLTGSPLIRHFTDTRNSIFEFKDAQDRQTMLMALRKVRGYPLWVTVGVAQGRRPAAVAGQLGMELAHGSALHPHHPRRDGADSPKRNRREAEVGTTQAHA